MTSRPAPAATTLLLPARRRFAGQPLGPRLAMLLGRADRRADGDTGLHAQLVRHFDVLPRGLPIAAIVRALDAGRDDAQLHAWLRADPTHVRPDMTGARVLAIGGLAISREEADALVAALRTTFGDAGMPISAPQPERWYLALAREAKLPAFAAPEDVLGTDLLAHLPDGPDGRRWRALLNEAQVILHNHPVNAARAAAGKPVVNSLTFWGGGRLPDHVRTVYAAVRSDASDLRALAALAGVGAATGADAGASGPVLMDGRGLRDIGALEHAVVEQAAAAGNAGVTLDFADGAAFVLRPAQRWRIWRRPLSTLA